MAHPSWGSGWPNCVTTKIVTVTTGELRLPVRREVAQAVAGLVTELARARGRPFRADWSWGFACRAISGTSTASNHSWGLAIDLDAPENPYMDASTHQAPHPLRKKFANGKTMRSTMPDDASAIARKWGFRWGGDYSTKLDPMHFEFMGSIDDAKRIGSASGIKGVPSQPKKGRPTLSEGDRGNPVRTVQRKLIIEVDGIFGSGTTRAVKTFQGDKGLTADGVVGTLTWAELRKKQDN